MDATGVIARAAAIVTFRTHLAHYNTILARMCNPQNRRHPKTPPAEAAYAAIKWYGAAMMLARPCFIRR